LWHLKLELWYDLANIIHHVGQEVGGFDYAFLACDLFLAEDVYMFNTGLLVDPGVFAAFKESKDFVQITY